MSPNTIINIWHVFQCHSSWSNLCDKWTQFITVRTMNPDPAVLHGAATALPVAKPCLQPRSQPVCRAAGPAAGGAWSRSQKLALDQGAKGQKPREDWALISVSSGRGASKRGDFCSNKAKQTKPHHTRRSWSPSQKRRVRGCRSQGPRIGSAKLTQEDTGWDSGLPSPSQSSGQIAAARAELSSLLLFPLPWGSEAILFFPLCLSQWPAKAVGILPLTSTGFGSASFCRGGNIIVSSERLCNSCGVRGV